MFTNTPWFTGCTGAGGNCLDDIVLTAEEGMSNRDLLLALTAFLLYVLSQEAPSSEEVSNIFTQNIEVFSEAFGILMVEGVVNETVDVEILGNLDAGTTTYFIFKDADSQETIQVSPIVVND